jgi:hypothetical protein
MPLTLFSFGYHGWGNHTADLVRAVDAVEAARGFGPPVFVDTRIRRSVRAAGFTGNAFGELLGDRHVWMPRLGNKHILSRTGPYIQIADPAAADDLLDLAVGRPERRVIFFCACKWPRCGGEVACHRVEVGRLVLAAALRRGEDVEVVEWPGGTPRRIGLDVPANILRAIRAGRATVPLPAGVELADVAGLPWGSVAEWSSGGEACARLIGPAVKLPGGWALPVFGDPAGAATFRRDYGLEPLSPAS